MLSKGFDVTAFFNANGFANLDMGDYDYILVQIVGSNGTISFLTTNDGGAVQGETTGNATSSTSYTAVRGTNLGTGSAATSASSGNSIWQFSYIGRYIQLNGAGITATKILVEGRKIM